MIIFIPILAIEMLHFIIGVVIFINTGFDNVRDVNKSTVKLYKTFIVGGILCCFIWSVNSYYDINLDKIKRWLRK